MDKNGPTVRPEIGPCWVWKGAGAKCGDGYGMIKTKKMSPAHCVSWEMHNSPIPNGLWVLHRCDNPPCVNPEHLFLGTRQDNALDMASKFRTAVNGAPRLSPDKVRQIRAEHAAGVPHKLIGAAFGRSTGSIADIVHARRYAHVL